MSGSSRERAISVWHVAWLVIFVVDASLEGRGRGHQLGALALGMLFATLVVGELRATRRQTYDD